MFCYGLAFTDTVAVLIFYLEIISHQIDNYFPLRYPNIIANCSKKFIIKTIQYRITNQTKLYHYYEKLQQN